LSAPDRPALRRLLIAFSLAGIVPMAIVATVLLVALRRMGAARPELEPSLAALAALVLLVLLAASLFCWLLGRSLLAAFELPGPATAEPPRPAPGHPPQPSAEENAQLRRALEEERRTRQAAEAASRKRDELLAMLGHELRNPLGAIGGAVRVIERLPASSADHKAAREIVVRQTEHLARIVEDLADIGGVAGGRIALRRNLVDLAQATAGAVAAIRHSSGHEWDLELAPVLVSVDPLRMEQVLANLLGAAARRTPASGRIAVRVAAADGDALLRIQAGAGELQAPPEIRLSLAQRLVDLHGGRLDVETPPGEGARFTVRLPAIPEPEPVAERAARPPPAPRPARQARVLLVEDNDDARVTLQRILQADGHLVSAARDARAGLEAAIAGSPTVAIVDIGLPGMDGYQFARAMRERLGHGVRLIAVTGYGAEADRRRAMEAGFDAHLTKPVDIDRLLALISGT
jgi:signal transduction histidine kinase